MRQRPENITYLNTPYTKKALIGSGRNSEVYRYESPNKPPLAVKFPSEEVLQYCGSNTEMLTRSAKREATLNRMIHGIGDTAEAFSIVTRLFEGKTLEAHFYSISDGRYKIASTCSSIHHIARVWLLAASAVLLLHSNTKIVHCDLKPGNLVLSPDEKQVSIIDWGAAIQNPTFIPQSKLLTPAEKENSLHTPPDYVKCSNTHTDALYRIDDLFDAYSMGDLLSLLHKMHREYILSDERCRDTLTTNQKHELGYVLKGLMSPLQSNRFQLQVGICLVNNIFFSGISKEIPEHHATLLLIFSSMINAQCSLLEREKAADTGIIPFSRNRKKHKINGLHELQQALAHCSGDLASFVEAHLKPALKKSSLISGAGFFDFSRTESLLNILDKIVLSAGEKRSIGVMATS